MKKRIYNSILKTEIIYFDRLSKTFKIKKIKL